MKRNSKPSLEEQTQYIAGFVADELNERFQGRKLQDINDHEIVDIITRLLSSMPEDSDWVWARREGKKLGVSGAELLTMRWSKANALAAKKGLDWAIKPMKQRVGSPASGTPGASRSRKPASAGRRG